MLKVGEKPLWHLSLQQGELTAEIEAKQQWVCFDTVKVNKYGFILPISLKRRKRTPRAYDLSSGLTVLRRKTRTTQQENRFKK